LKNIETTAFNGRFFVY